MKYLLYKLAIISCIFSYNSLLLFSPSDVQPWALLFSTCYLLWCFLVEKLSISFEGLFYLIGTLLLLLFYSIVFVDTSNNLLLLRSTFGYISAPLIFIFAQSIREKKYFQFLEKIFFIAIFIYLLGTIFQLFFP